MSALGQEQPGSFDEILAAVKETARGRWFLETFEDRVKATESSRILGAISRLENHIQSVGGSEGDAALVRQARDAIAAARRDIAGMNNSSQGLSAEGQLFARLAMLSRQAFSGPPNAGRGIERALRLVADLDQALFTPQVLPLRQTSESALFAQDEAIFAPAPATKLPAPELPEQQNPQAKGATVTIHHLNAPPAADDLTEKQRAPEEAPTSSLSSVLIETEGNVTVPNSRIMIIRRSAEEMDALPLADSGGEPRSESSAA
jgi:hypothetical protein